MVAVVVREVIGKQRSNIRFADLGKIKGLNFKQIELYLSWWNMNGVSTY
jgi:hypothetical protein